MYVDSFIAGSFHTENNTMYKHINNFFYSKVQLFAQ